MFEKSVSGYRRLRAASASATGGGRGEAERPSEAVEAELEEGERSEGIETCGTGTRRRLRTREDQFSKGFVYGRTWGSGEGRRTKSSCEEDQEGTVDGSA